MRQSVNFLIINAVIVGVSMLSDVLEERGWSSGKVLKAWVIGYQRTIVFSNIKTSGQIDLESDKWVKKRKTIKKWLGRR